MSRPQSSKTDSELDKLEKLDEILLLPLAKAKVSVNEVGGWHFDLPHDALDEVRAALAAYVAAEVRRARLRDARDYWLYVHDIVRDKPTKTIGIQEAIDVASEAYKLLTGEDIQKWFDEDAELVDGNGEAT